MAARQIVYVRACESIKMRVLIILSQHGVGISITHPNLQNAYPLVWAPYGFHINVRLVLTSFDMSARMDRA